MTTVLLTAAALVLSIVLAYVIEIAHRRRDQHAGADDEIRIVRCRGKNCRAIGYYDPDVEGYICPEHRAQIGRRLGIDDPEDAA